ncbi:MAG: helix-turn-helix domain-containing protein [Gemmatimonadota bacterium]
MTSVALPLIPNRHYWEAGWWEVTRREADPRLAGHVQGPYLGWTEQTSRVIGRREYPSRIVPLILNLGPPYRVSWGNAGKAPPESVGSFLSGLSDTFAVVEGATHSSALQVDLAPASAYMLFGVPMDALANRVVDLHDVAGADGRRLIERLCEAPGWGARFNLVDAFLLKRLASAVAPSKPVLWAWQRLEATGGRIEIGSLAAEIGWSHKHLIAQFREQLGLPPKTIARIVRFERLLRRIGQRGAPRWTEMALECGYYDQAHLIRDVGGFTGRTPTELLGERLPAGGGVVDR